MDGGFRLVSRAALAGAAIGIAAGAVARLAMRLLFVLNPDTRGIIVGEQFPVGGFTARGTGLILIMALVLGTVAGTIYGLARPALPRHSLLSGLIFGGWLVATFLGFLIEGEDQDFRLFGPFAIAAGLFAVVFVAFGVGLGVAVDRSGSTEAWHRAGKVRATVTWFMLSVTAVAGTILLIQEVAART
jgi:hypothetical protein